MEFDITSLYATSLYTCETIPVCKMSQEAELLEDAAPSPLVKVSLQTLLHPLLAHESLAGYSFPFVYMVCYRK